MLRSERTFLTAGSGMTNAHIAFLSAEKLFGASKKLVQEARSLFKNIKNVRPLLYYTLGMNFLLFCSEVVLVS